MKIPVAKATMITTAIAITTAAMIASNSLRVAAGATSVENPLSS